MSELERHAREHTAIDAGPGNRSRDETDSEYAASERARAYALGSIMAQREHGAEADREDINWYGGLVLHAMQVLDSDMAHT